MTSWARASKQSIAGLAPYGSCDIADALLKLNSPSGGFLPDIIPFSPREPKKIIGEAFTLKVVDGEDSAAPKPSQHFADAVEPESIMVISVPPHCKNAVWGGLMTARAQARQVKGVVIDGRFRDIGEQREFGFPVYARGQSILGQGTYTRPSELQVPLEIHPITLLPPNYASPRPFPSTRVDPYSIIVADEDGVVVIPAGHVDQVVKLCQEGVEADTKCMKDLKKGRPLVDTFKEHRG